MRLFILVVLLINMMGCGSADTLRSKFTTVMHDDFTYNDQTIWQKANWANGNPFYNAWCPNQITFNASNLGIRLEKLACNGSTHASGEYRTYNTYKYGKYTTRLQASDVNGTISSLFTYTGPAEGTAWDEIDIEILGKSPTKMQINYWRNSVEHPKIIDLGFNAALGMHTYSFIWNPEYISWYVDGILVHTVYENHLNNTDSLPINAGKIILNLWAATGIDSWSGLYDTNATAQVSYDYVKFEVLN